jgi:hypothetical protein
MMAAIIPTGNIGSSSTGRCGELEPRAVADDSEYAFCVQVQELTSISPNL